MAAVAQVQDDVEHRQAGADQQHRLVRPHHPQRVRPPGIADVARARIEAALLGRDRRIGRRVVAHAQHHAIGIERVAIGQHDARAALLRNDAVDVADHRTKAQAAAGLHRRIAQQPFQIVPVQAPRHEAAGLYARILALRELEEAAFVAGQRAHARGRHVEHVRRRAGAVGDAAREQAGAVDQHHLQRRGRRPAQQMHGQRGAAKAGADDRDRGHGGTALRVRRRSGRWPRSAPTGCPARWRHGRRRRRRGSRLPARRDADPRPNASGTPRHSGPAR